MSHNSNLFKKAHHPVLQTISTDGVTNRQNTNRDQGCLQVPPNIRKKSAGVPSTVKTALAFGSGVLKSNNTRINAVNQPSVILQAKAINQKEKTPTRPLTRSDLSHQHLLQPSVNKAGLKASQSTLSKSPAPISHQISYIQKSP